MEAVLPMLFPRDLSLSLPWFPFPVHLRRGEREVLVSTWYPARVHPAQYCIQDATSRTSAQFLFNLLMLVIHCEKLLTDSPTWTGKSGEVMAWPRFSLDTAKNRSSKTIFSACETVSKFKDSRAAGNYSNVRFLWGIHPLCVFSYSSLPLYLAFAILSLKLVTWCFLSLLDKSAWKLRICKCGVSCYYHL